MSTRFIAPPLSSRTSSASATEQPTQNPADKNGRLPPPLHPALTRRRIVPPGSESFGALNSSSASLSSALAPGISQNSLYNTPSHAETQSSGADPLSPYDIRSTQITQTAQSHELEQNMSSSSTSISPTGDPSTPILLVTPAGGSSAEDAHLSAWRSDTLPPYTSLPDLTTQSQTPQHIDARNSTIDVPASAQYPETSLNEHQLPPPMHPSRQPSPSSSTINLPSTLRHRASSNGSLRMPEPGLANPPPRIQTTRQASTMSVLTLKDENLTDEDLRNLYDAEEVERYLRLFASRVSEVTIHPDRADSSATIRADDEDEWVSLSSTPAPPLVQQPITLPPRLANPSTPFEHIAALIYPHVAQPPPPPSAPKRKFKLSKAAAAAERLYIATYPAYVPPLLYICHLASWHDTRLSAFWCATFWVAWAFGFLTPLIVGRILLALVRGGTVTREEIRRKREATREAELLGKAIQGGVPGVGVGGNFGVWQLMKMVGKRGKKNGKKAKGVVEELRKDGDEVDGVGDVSVGDVGDTGAAVDGGEVADAEDWKLAIIDVAEELADLHERVKNIFLHRRAATTRTYTIILTLLFIATVFIQNTSKLITLTIGIFFWFIPPIVKLLPKLPPAFADAPTDAEVAMDLIARRVARGERVIPERISRRKKRATKAQSVSTGAGEGTSTGGLGSPGSSLDLTKLTSPSTTSLLEGSATEDEDGDVGFVMPKDQEEAKEGTEVYEEKFRKGAVKAWNWLGKAKGLMDEVRGVEGGRGTYAAPEQSFPAQHSSRPGMLMISATHLTFNPLFAPASATITSSSSVPCHTTAASKNTIHVDIDHLRGVKKVSPGGLIVRYERGGEVVEERFLLVVGRDEAFATLVGWGGGRWKHV